MFGPLPYEFPPCLRIKRNFLVQASNALNEVFSGCCCHRERRLVVVYDSTLYRYHPGTWDLFAMSTSFLRNSTAEIDQFALVPHSLGNAMIDQCRVWEERYENWKFLGAINPAILGMDVKEKISKHLGVVGALRRTNNKYHWHIYVFMENMKDESQSCLPYFFKDHPMIYPFSETNLRLPTPAETNLRLPTPVDSVARGVTSKSSETAVPITSRPRNASMQQLHGQSSGTSGYEQKIKKNKLYEATKHRSVPDTSVIVTHPRKPGRGSRGRISKNRTSSSTSDSDLSVVQNHKQSNCNRTESRVEASCSNRKPTTEGKTKKKHPKNCNKNERRGGMKVSDATDAKQSGRPS
jgi:hypothetical protein